MSIDSDVPAQNRWKGVGLCGIALLAFVPAFIKAGTEARSEESHSPKWQQWLALVGGIPQAVVTLVFLIVLGIVFGSHEEYGSISKLFTLIFGRRRK